MLITEPVSDVHTLAQSGESWLGHIALRAPHDHAHTISLGRYLRRERIGGRTILDVFELGSLRWEEPHHE